MPGIFSSQKNEMSWTFLKYSWKGKKMKVSVWVYQHQTEAFCLEKNNNFKNCDPYFTQKIPGI